jgi:CRISPR system Cascade subunit CasD
VTRYLLLRFEAPMQAYGGVRIDALPGHQPIPTPSMVTGLFGCALGLDRREVDRLQALQDALSAAVAVLRPGVIETDYQTADLTVPNLRGPMWTVGGAPFHRAGSKTALERRQQERRYLADADLLLAVWLSGPCEWTVNQLAAALDEPYRVPFLGRAYCPPTARLAQGIVDAADPVSALTAAAPSPVRQIYVPAACGVPVGPGADLVSVSGRRRWAADVVAGTETYLRIVP